MKSNAYELTTIKQTRKRLRYLMSNCNTNNPEEVKEFVSEKKCSNAYKECLIKTYDIYMQSKNREWKKPFYSRYDKKRKVPKEQLIDFIIQHAKPVTRLKLMVEKDLGARPIELFWLNVGDIDLTNGNVSITGAKHTIGREGKLKASTLSLLKLYIEKKNLRINDQIFRGKNADNFAENHRHLRNSLAKKYNMPELKQVQRYDFRRRKGTIEYKLSRHNFLHVKKISGHKDARSTEKYITEDEQIKWEPIKAITDEEKKECFAKDYEFMTNDNGIFWFRKPKE